MRHSHSVSSAVLLPATACPGAGKVGADTAVPEDSAVDVARPVAETWTGALSFQGVWWLGEGWSAWAGSSVAGGRDLDGDARPDLVIGAPSWGGDAEGAACVVSGAAAQEGGWLGDAHVVNGRTESDAAGWTVRTVDDLDADGLADVAVGVIGKDGAEENAGGVYVISGPEAMTDQLLPYVPSWAGETRGDQAGIGLGGLGDIDGDGLGELLVGAPSGTASATGAGVVYVVSGVSSRADGSLSDASVRWEGEATGDWAGLRVAGLGDVDGDGVADAMMSAYNASVGGVAGGVAYFITGSDLLTGGSLADATAGWWGSAEDDRAGSALAGPGDVDGDGLADVVVCSNAAVSGGDLGGAVHLLTSDVVATGGALADATATWTAETYFGPAGSDLAGAGDLDADGRQDIVVGAPYADAGGESAGAVYVLLGADIKDGGSLADASARWFSLVEGAYAGWSVASAGDVNGDGLGDLLAGVREDEGDGRGSGAAILFLMR